MADPDSRSPFGKLYDMLMLMVFGSRLRTEAEVQALFAQTGFTLTTGDRDAFHADPAPARRGPGVAEARPGHLAHQPSRTTGLQPTAYSVRSCVAPLPARG